MKPTVDPKRTGVKAVLGSEEWPDGEYDEPGTMRKVANSDGSFYGFMIACPGCGRNSAMRVGEQKPALSPSWQASGNIDDVTTLTLTPSINCVGCCGWHGWLKNGVFQSC